MNILAHRTAMANAPSNSMEGLRLAHFNNVYGAECDLVFIDKKAYVWEDKNGKRDAVGLQKFF